MDLQEIGDLCIDMGYRTLPPQQDLGRINHKVINAVRGTLG